MSQIQANSAVDMSNLQSMASALLGKTLQLEDAAALINFMTLCRKEGERWRLIHAKTTPESISNMGEVIQVLEYNLMGNNPTVLRMDESGQALAFFSANGARNFGVIETEIIQTFRAQNVSIHTDALGERGVAYVEKVLTPVIPEKDVPGRIALRRFSRLSNMFMVLDDDQVVLRMMDHMLKSTGHVETHDNVRQFLTAYNKYAPNAVFVDIHLQGDRGTNVAQMLSEKVDPASHIVMISADAIKPNILESKYKGAKGFIGKPLNMEVVLRNVASVPTLYGKKLG